MAEGRYLAFVAHSDHLINESGATDLLAMSSTANWLIQACTPLINQETLEKAHGMANSEISLSLITSIT